MSRGELMALKNLISLQEVGGFVLPEELISAYARYTQCRTLTLEPPAEFSVDTAAAQLVASLATDTPAGVFDLARRFDQSITDRRVLGHAQTILQQAEEQAGDAATHVASDLVEAIIVDRLRPAFLSVLDEARSAAAVLAGQDLDPAALLRASAKIRGAYLELAPLATRISAIQKARTSTNRIGNRQVQHDVTDIFWMFRTPQALDPDWTVGARIQQPQLPEDPGARLLWLASDAAAVVGLWMPTTVEQDDAWLDVYGEAQQTRADAAHFARGFAAF